MLWWLAHHGKDEIYQTHLDIPVDRPMPCCIMSVRVIRPEHATIDNEVQNFNNPKSRSFTAQEISANFAGLQIVSS